MASASVETAGGPSPGQLLLDCVAGHGSAAHPWPRNRDLAFGPDAARNLSDLLHFVLTLHGRYPGVVDHASDRAVEREARSWLAEAASAFAGERGYLARLAVAAGPVPSTPGAADSDTVVRAQRHAIEMLARSERNGCALGAAMAVVLDWAQVRRVLDAAAQRFGVEPPPYRIADEARIAGLADEYAASPAVRRALLFGAEQILVQHFGLWDLLEARAQARTAG